MFRTLTVAMLVFLSLNLSAKALDCANAQTQFDMNQCADLDWQRADKALNAEYKRARARMRQLDQDLPANLEGAEIALRDAQRAWIKYRDAACVAEGFLFRGGTMEPLIVSTCMASLTEARTRGLQTLSQTN
ncbi:MAG: lysozyme inhibitor LprI family protein [Paracoccaceae bacterium]